MSGLALASLLAFVACVGAPSPSSGGVSLNATETEAGFEFHVVARGRAQGRYSLTVLKSGASGTSRSAQSGRFDVEKDATVTLSASRTNAVSGDRVAAELVVTWADGRTTTEEFEQTVQ